MVECFVLCKSRSGPGCLATDVTHVGNSSDVVGFYVVFYIGQFPLLATNFTDHNCPTPITINHGPVGSFHHGFDLGIQMLRVSRQSVVSDSYSFFYKGLRFNFMNLVECIVCRGFLMERGL